MMGKYQGAGNDPADGTGVPGKPHLTKRTLPTETTFDRMAEADDLLKAALDLFNDHPNFRMRHDRTISSYDLAARIDAYFRKRKQ